VVNPASAGTTGTTQSFRYAEDPVLFRFDRGGRLVHILDVSTYCVRSRVWIIALLGGLIGAVFWVGKCRRSDDPAAVVPAPRGVIGRSRPESQNDIEAWSRRFAVQQPPPEQLRADPATTTSALGNGLRYVLLENTADVGEVSLRLMVLAGSMHESAGEEGFAHFIEHLSFQEQTGPEGVPAIAAFEGLCLTTGADSNAHTAPDHTLYRLDLPVADDETLETTLGFLRRVAGGLGFTGETVDAERRVILREIGERPAGTMLYRKSAALLPEMKAARHRPAGSLESLAAANAAALRDFWQRHYVPSRMVLVAAGDFNADAMEVRIHRHFDSLPGRPAEPDPDPGDPLMTANSIDLICLSNEGDERIAITLAAPQATDLEPEGLEKRRRELVRAVGLKMVERRLARDFHEAEIPGTPPSSSAVELIPGVGWIEVSSKVSPEDAPHVLRMLLYHWRTALAYEFHHSEFAEARGEIRKHLRRQFVSRLTRSTPDMATRAAEAARTGRLVESPEDELNRSLTDLAMMSRRECEALLKAEWGVPPPRIVIAGAIQDSTEDLARLAIDRAMSDSISPRRHTVEDERWSPEPLGAPGEVVRRELDEPGGYLEAEFSNRVLVRLAPMASLGGSVEVKVHVGYGRLSEPMDRPGLALATVSLCRWHPLEHWSQHKLNAALVDEDLSHRLYLGQESFVWSGSTDRSQLRRQLDLLANLIGRPGLANLPEFWKPGAHVKAWENDRRRTYQASGRLERVRLMTGRDPRFDPIPSSLMETDSEQAADWLLPILAGGRIAVMIAGDFEPIAALDAAAATFGALPERVSWHEPSPHPVPPTAQPGTHYSPKGSNSSSAVTLAMPMGPRSDANEELRRWILEELLQIRLRSVMRETRGDSYAPRAFRWSMGSDCAEWLMARVPCRAGQSADIADALRALVLEFRDKGWSRDEFRRATRPLIYQLRRRSRSPEYRLSDLMAPERIATRTMLEGSNPVGLENAVRELASRVLDPEIAVELRVDED
jgi:zinc protease